ncbi:peptide MFS transporter [Niveispirillum sp. KHB5.9]|uniref:peptide MFS transporter n=1 Tax=Niveispirillum sp. KHB5.9 TaxID=3400269 RepID=UPI003A8C2798
MTGSTPATGRHPRELAILAGVEFWERFSYYGLQANLIFFLTWHLDLPREEAYRYLAAFAALVFMCPLIGGHLADRWLGARRVVVAGLAMLLLGHALMVVMPGQTRETLVLTDGGGMPIDRPLLHPREGEGRTIALPDGPAQVLSITQAGDGHLLHLRTARGEERTLSGRLERTPDQGRQTLFHLTLALIAAGVGFLKPNISALVGSLYGRDEALRNQGFTLFYMGINAGGLTGSLVCGWLAFRHGWEPGFAAAGLGMVVALLLMRAGRHIPAPQPVAPASRPALVAFLAGTALILCCWALLDSPVLVERLLDIAALAAIVYVAWQSRGLSAGQKRDLLVLVLLMLGSVLFWTLLGQSPGSLNMFTAEWVELRLLGLEIPAPALQFVPFAFVMALSLPMAGLWRWLDRKGRTPHPVTLSGLGGIQMGASFLVLVIGILLLPDGARLGLGWLVALYLLQAGGELFLSPIGLAAITRLSPPAITSTMLGLWFLCTAYAQKLAGLIGQATVADSATNPAEGLERYAQVYQQAGLITVAAGLLIILAGLLIRRRSRPA